MPIDANVVRRVAWLEGVILLLATPFLLFPTQFSLLTGIVVALLVAGWLICWRFSAFPLKSTPFNGAFLVFSLATLVGIAVTADPDLTLPKATGMILAFAAWRYMGFYVTTRKRVWLAFIVFLGLGMGMGAMGLLSADWRFEVPFVQAIFRLLPPQLVNLPGAAESGVHTNQLAGTLLFFVTLPLAFVADHRLFVRRMGVLLLAALALALLAALLVLTQSRSAWMGAAAGLVAYLFLWLFLTVRDPRQRRLLWLAVLLAMVLAAVLIALAWPTLVAALYEDLPDDTPIGTLQTLAFRYEIWRWAIPAIGDFPFTGTGLGTFRRVVTRLYPIYYTIDIAHAHNVFLQVALDVGLPGLIGYLSIQLLAVLGAITISRRAPQMRPLALGLLTGLIAFHVYGLTDTLALGSKPALALWLAVALLGAAWNVVQGPTAGSTPYPDSNVYAETELSHA